MIPLSEDVVPAEKYDVMAARADYIDKVYAEGNHVVFPNVDQLQIDIDGPEHRAVFDKIFAIFKAAMNQREIYFEVEEHPSISRMLGKSHITITVPGWDMNATDRIAWQAALGSDPVREILSCIRAMDGDQFPTLFAERGPGSGLQGDSAMKAHHPACGCGKCLHEFYEHLPETGGEGAIFAGLLFLGLIVLMVVSVISALWR